ncbi:MAG: polyribonucleotide nucleotidyltransferase, partial [Spirochaetales bacterium]
MIQRVTYKIGSEELVLETGRIAKQANGSVYATFAGSAIIATVCASSSSQEGLDYVPLTVDYNEKFYAAGKIPGGFIKREGRPKDKEILVSRLIDRPMRPLFDKAFGRDIQIIPTCVSSDQLNPPDILSIVASSAAVHISDIPFNGPVAGVRVGYIDGEYILNPTYEQLKKTDIEIIVAGTADGFTMVEGGANEVSEEVMLGALEKAQEFITAMCQLQDELRKLAGKEKLPLAPLQISLENKEAMLAETMPKMEVACFVKGKHERRDAIKSVKAALSEKYSEQLTDDMQKKLFDALFEDMEYDILRKTILDKGVRVDGRGTEDIRDITCEIGVLSRPHGSALFTRGETQALAVATLGTALDEQVYDDIDGDRSEHFILHYNFPPYSVGEVGRMGT